MLAVGGLPVFNVVVVKFYINCMVAILHSHRGH